MNIYKIILRSTPLIINLFLLIIKVKILAVNFDIEAMTQVAIVLTFTSFFSSVFSNPLSQTVHRFGVKLIYYKFDKYLVFPLIFTYVPLLLFSLFVLEIPTQIALICILIPSTIAQSILVGRDLNEDNIVGLWVFQNFPAVFRLMAVVSAVAFGLTIKHLLTIWFLFELGFTCIAFVYFYSTSKSYKINENFETEKMSNVNYFFQSGIYSILITAVLISDRFFYGVIATDITAFIYIKYQLIVMPYLILSQTYTQSNTHLFFAALNYKGKPLVLSDVFKNRELLYGFLIFLLPAAIGVVVLKIWLVEFINMISTVEYQIIASYTDLSLLVGLIYFMCQPLLIINQANLVIKKSIIAFFIALCVFIVLFTLSKNFLDMPTTINALISHDKVIFFSMLSALFALMFVSKLSYLTSEHLTKD